MVQRNDSPQGHNAKEENAMKHAHELFLQGYIVAALWSSSSSDPETGEDIESLEGEAFGPGEIEKHRAACADFIEHAAELLDQYAEERQFHSGGYSVWELAGHDFWLTRNGHGVGFWDRGLGELGIKLTEAAKSFGGVDLYLGDDGLVYS